MPSLRRWTRVFFSSLRCFFLALRLRRFLMTEPTGKPFACVARALLRTCGAQAGARATCTAYWPYRTVENRVAGLSPGRGPTLVGRDMPERTQPAL